MKKEREIETLRYKCRRNKKHKAKASTGKRVINNRM